MAPATHDDVAFQLAALVAAYPNSRADELFGRLIVSDVGASEPSVGALDAGCRHLRRTLKFPPAISEVCQAVESAADMFKRAIRHLDEMPRLISDARKMIAEAEEKRRITNEIAERRARRALSGPTSP
jgi:hypothetical protein